MGLAQAQTIRLFVPPFVDGIAKPPMQIGAQNPASACADAAVQGARR